MVLYRLSLSFYKIMGNLSYYNLNIRQFFPYRIFDASVIAMETRADAIDHYRISLDFGQFRAAIMGRQDARQAFDYIPDLFFNVRSSYCITHIEQSFASLILIVFPPPALLRAA
jgi:hypothetical protein